MNRASQLARRRVKAHGSRPRRLKADLTLAVVTLAVGLIVAWACLRRFSRFEGGFQLQVADFAWLFFANASRGLTLAAAAVFLAASLGLWPSRLTPRSLWARIAALAGALFCVFDLVLLRVLDVFSLEAIYRATLAAICLALAVALLHDAPGKDALSRLGAWLRRGGPCRGVGWIAFGLGCGASLLAWLWFFGGHVTIIDALAQVAQARLMLLGHVTLTMPQRVRDVVNIPAFVESVPSYSQFPPGYLVLLPPLIACGLPVQLVNIAASGGVVALTAALARRLTGSRLAGLIAAIMLACSPFFLVLAGTAMNHSVTCLALMTAAWCFLPAGPAPTRAQARARALLGGLMLGWAATIRPLTALAHGLAWCGVWGTCLWEDAWRRRSGRRPSARLDRAAPSVLRGVALVALALIPPLAGLAIYNLETTGHALRLAYRVNSPVMHRLGFFKAGEFSYGPLNAVENYVADLFDLNLVMLGWPIGSWVAAAPWWLRTRLGRGERALLALVAMQGLCYGLYNYHHLVLGPRFQYEALPLMIVLVAIGLAPLLRRGGQWSGILAAVLLALTLCGPLVAFARFGRVFEKGVISNDRIERFMRQLLPIRRPTVVVFPRGYIDSFGCYSPHDPGQPDLWFVNETDAAQARAVPELAGCDWVKFDPYRSVASSDRSRARVGASRREKDEKTKNGGKS
jgi:hypothetical protein